MAESRGSTRVGAWKKFEAGDAFVLEPGLVAFTPTAEAKEQMAVMMPNIMRYADEHGLELPGMAPSA